MLTFMIRVLFSVDFLKITSQSVVTLLTMDDNYIQGKPSFLLFLLSDYRRLILVMKITT